MITAFIDGDWILYAAGFAGQKERCVYVDGDVVIRADTQTEVREALAKINDQAFFNPECLFKRIERDDPRNVFHTAKLMIESNCRKISERFNDEVTPRIIIDGDGNFRSRIATIRPYKGTRNVHAKPVIYNELREYLVTAWRAEAVYDQESDDEMAILQTEAAAQKQKSIIVSVDKDMLQVPGLHLNPNKGFKKIGKQEALERQYVQCIQGDAVDNIAGAYKYGPVGARAAIEAGMSEEAMWKATVGCYETSLEKYDNPYRGLDAEAAALENMRLVYLRRERNELWMAPPCNKLKRYRLSSPV